MDGWMDGPLPLIFPGAQMLSKGRYCIGIEQVREVSESGRAEEYDTSIFLNITHAEVASTRHVKYVLINGGGRQAGGCGTTMTAPSKRKMHATP